jgi:hypothetical protein
MAILKMGKDMAIVPIKIFIEDGTFKTLALKSSETVEDAMTMLSNKLGMEYSPDHASLFEVNGEIGN